MYQCSFETGTDKKFVRQVVIFLSTVLIRFSETVSDILANLEKLFPLRDINSNWEDISYVTVGPHSLPELILKMV